MSSSYSMKPKPFMSLISVISPVPWVAKWPSTSALVAVGTGVASQRGAKSPGKRTRNKAASSSGRPRNHRCFVRGPKILDQKALGGSGERQWPIFHPGLQGSVRTVARKVAQVEAGGRHLSHDVRSTWRQAGIRRRRQTKAQERRAGSSLRLQSEARREEEGQARGSGPMETRWRSSIRDGRKEKALEQ